MKLFRLSLLALLCATTLLSCKKDDEGQNPNPQPEPVITTYDNYSALKVGNYWIYEYFDVDSMGNATSKNLFDSCYVKNDTIINGNTYYRLVQPSAYFSDPTIYPQSRLLRDSLHYIVGSRGGIQFSSQDFSTVFASRYQIEMQNDTLGLITVKMEPSPTTVTVPAGTFSTLNFRRTFNLYPNWSGPRNYGYEHSRYAKDVGLVVQTMPSYLLQLRLGMSVEKRLIRYHVQP